MFLEDFVCQTSIIYRSNLTNNFFKYYIFIATDTWKSPILIFFIDNKWVIQTRTSHPPWYTFSENHPLLSALRKTLSRVLSRIATKVDNFLSPSQSGFRRGRSTADVIFGYRWLCAKALRQRVTIEFLCIDLSRAFDTIRRDKLLEVLQSFLDEPVLRMIRFLLTAMSLEPRLSTGECHAFASTIGTPQGDSFSPVLFTVYLEAALRDLRSRLPPRPPGDARLPLDVEYADDIDFISYSRSYLNEIERIAPVCLGEWSLQINAAKTERTSVSRQVDGTHESWRTTRKLGSLLGDAEDVTRRMQLANVSFHKMWTVWFRVAQISLLLRLRLYSAFVLPVLTYNMGTWGLTKTELSRLLCTSPSSPAADHRYPLATPYLKRCTLSKNSFQPH